MIDSFALLYALLVAIVVLIIFAIKRIAKVRVWIHTRMSSKDSLREIAYLELDDTQTAGEIHLVGASNVPPVGRVIVDNDSKISRGFVELLTSDLNDDSVKPRYRNIGYIGFDATDISVDEYGFIYKQIKGKKQKEVVGYTARPSKPNTPTIYGERSWKTLWLKCTLCAYVGEPHPELDEKPRKKADKEVVVSTTDNSLSPVVESLCINAKKVCKINVVLNDIKDVESNDVVDESNVENEPLSIDSNEVIQSLVLDDVATSNMENKYESNVEIQEELIGGSDKNLEVEEGIENDFNVDLIEDNAPLESSIEEENTEVVSEKELVLVLSDEEKARLDKLKLNNPQLISTIVKNMVKIEGGEFVMGSDSASENNDYMLRLRIKSNYKHIIY